MVRPDCTPGKVVLAVVRVIQATFNEGRWRELGLIVGKSKLIENHPRLLRSLHWGDDDYDGCVIEVVPKVLGRTRDEYGESRFTNLKAVEDYLDLRNWLRHNDPSLHEALYGDDALDEALESLVASAQGPQRISVNEYAVRIRRNYPDDLPAAIGAAKELLESVYKQLLGLGRESRYQLPDLAKRLHVKLGLDDQCPPGEEPGARQKKDLLKGLNLVVDALAQLRNQGFGTGHGHYERPELDPPAARLAITAAIAAATFYIEVAHADTAQSASW